MKKINLNESDLLNIVNKVLNEQDERQFDEGEIELLHFIFERELKPPFTKGNKDNLGNDPYHNREGEWIGFFESDDIFIVTYYPFMINIRDKVCQVFGFSLDPWDWNDAIKPHLTSWLEDQLNTKIRYLYP